MGATQKCSDCGQTCSRTVNMCPTCHPPAVVRAHTPGPWGLPLQVTATAPQTTVIAENAFGCIVEVATTAGKGDSLREAEANARLIAAAPEMLEALRVLCAWHGHPALTGRPSGTPVPESVPDFHEAVQMVHAAIAKAEGRC